MKRSLVIVLGVAVLAGLAGTGRALAQDEEEQYAALSFIVVRDYNGKPVKNASVIMHPVTKKGKQGRTGFQLKTNSEGKTQYDGIPYGPLRVQVLVPGFQTFGEDYEINKPQTEITIRLKRPQEQYSIYGDQAKKEEQKPAEGRPEEKAAEQKPQ